MKSSHISQRVGREVVINGNLYYITIVGRTEYGKWAPYLYPAKKNGKGFTNSPINHANTLSLISK